MAKFDYDMIVIGGGAAGLTTASGAAQLGARTLLLEKESELGGDCLHFGCVPSKTLIKSAKVYNQLKNLPKYGLPELTVPPVDFQSVTQRIRRVIGVIQQHDSVERFNKLGAEVDFQSPVFRDEHTLEYNGRSVTSAKLLIATGSAAAVPEIEGLERVGFITNKEIFSLEKLPESLVIIGAGAIAVEMAQAMNRLGADVTLIQRSNQILSKEDRDMADGVMEAMQKEGVAFHLGCRIIRVEKSGEKKKITVEQGGRQLLVEGDEILVALGRAPNLDGLGLEAVGIARDNKGILVDEKMRTNHKHIYAAGDVTGKYQFTHAAGYEGGIVVTNAILRVPRKANYTWMPWCTYTSPELASIGMNEKTALRAGLEYRVISEEFSDNDRALAEEEPIGRIKLLLNKRDKPLGVQIFGPRAGDVIAEWVAVVSGGVRMSHLAGAVHPYPTLAEINKKAAGSIFSQRIFSERTRKVLAMIFGYRGSSV